MLKKFWGIFKRDKSHCSYQELIWQNIKKKKVVVIVKGILYFAGIGCILLLGINNPIFSNEYAGSFRNLAGLAFMIVYVVISEIVIILPVKKILNIKRIEEQLMMREIEILYLCARTGDIKVSISNAGVKVSPLNSSNGAKELIDEMKKRYPNFTYEEDKTHCN